MILSFYITGVLAFLLMPFLNKFKHNFKKLGPNHESKLGTPSMGGVIFIIGSIISYFILVDFNIINLFYILPFLMYSIIGLIDDLLKHFKKSNDGLSVKNKLILQIIAASIIFYIYLYLNLDTYIFNINIKWLYGLFLLILFTSTSNAFNLTDGIDGLLTGIVIINLTFFYIILDNELKILTEVVISALIVFLIINFKKAKIFMGDTGSLSLGALVTSLSIFSKTEIYLLILLIPEIIEALSVIIQVIYYKLTKKRFFKMAPIHHHLEKIGYSEEKINFIFYILGIISLLLTLFIFNVVK